MSSFKDHFSSQADAYARFRPGYPPALFDWLAVSAPGRRLAVDCATGNGQAAVELAQRFQRVVATDGSVRQLAQARPEPNLAYAAALAEGTPLAGSCADLITVAQALHWFDHPRFNAEVRRLARPGAVVAAWTYALLRLAPQVDAELDDFYRSVVGAYWPPERRFVENDYRDIPFPFQPLEPPPLEITARWSPGDLLSYIGTWSAVVRYKASNGVDPVPAFARRLAAVWGEEETLPVRWRLTLLAGRVGD